MKLIYLNVDHIIYLNKSVLKLWKVKKGDKHQVMSYSKIEKIVEDYKNLEGGFYDKAVCLVKGITKAHAFASGNRRTALMCMMIFAFKNKQKIFIPDDPSNSRALLGMRYDYYTDDEIREWIKHGKIKEYPKR